MVKMRLRRRATLFRFEEILQQSLSDSSPGQLLAAAWGSSMSSPAAFTASIRHALRRFRRNRRGSSAVEFALVAPVFFALLFAIIETVIVFSQARCLRPACRTPGGSSTSEISYRYSPAVGDVMGKTAVNLSDFSYTRPRQSSCVMYSTTVCTTL
jgi:Flp pilus assembly pilin Flp